MSRQNYSRSVVATVIETQRQSYILPAFTLSVPTWSGASTLIAQYPLNNSVYISLRAPIDEFGENFVAAIRWVTGNIANRYKLFDHDDAVLSYPVYSGERIGLNAVLEIWSVDSEDAPTLDDNETLESSVLMFPAGTGNALNCPCCCVQPSSEILLVADTPVILPPGADCNPFCDGMCDFT